MTFAIQCSDLVKRYDARPPVEAVRGLELSVRTGECFGLLGPNGAGKTTTIEIIEGLTEPTSGTVEILGMSWQHDDRSIRQRLGISLQETRLSEKLLVDETVTLFRSFYDSGPAPAEVIRQVALEEKARTRVGKLSGGQKQRLAVACALVGDPDLLLLDEPTTGLDPQSRRQLWDIIVEFRNRGRTILLTTHYMDEAERLCDRVAVVDHGKVIALGTPRELIASLGGEHVVGFTLETDGSAVAWYPDTLSQLPSVRSIRSENGQFSLSVEEPHVAIPAILAHLQEHGQRLASLTTRHASLEDVFVTLTGRHLRDGEATP